MNYKKEASEKMSKGTVRLYLGCDDDRFYEDVKLIYYSVDDYPEYVIKTKLDIDPKDISAVEVGPRTILELFKDGDLYGEKKVIKNTSYSDKKHVELGCFKDEIWAGNYRSFRIWTHEYWDSLYGIRHCKKDDECYSTEYCLCPNGYLRGEYCNGEKICSPKSHFLQSRPLEVRDADLVNIPCLNDLFSKDKNGFINFRDIRNMSKKCLNKKNVVYEVFDPLNPFGNNGPKFNLNFIIMLMVVVFGILFLIKN